MKNGNFFKSVLFAFLAITTFSCSDDDDAGAPQSNTIAAIASRTPNLSILVQALDRVDLVDAVDGTTQLTVFAPTNTAFQNYLTANGLTSLDQVSDADLTQLLLNHVVAGGVQSSQLSTGYGVKTLATYNGGADRNLNLYVNTTSGVRLNGVSSVVTPNIIASNGVVHVVDAVIGLPTVVTFAQADPTFDLLEAALTREGNTTNFPAALSAAGPFTVFAPTNDAFTALLTELGGIGLADIPEPTLDAVLKYHVATGAFGNVLSSGLTPNGTTNVPTLFGASPTINITLPGTGGNIANVTDGAGRASGIVAVDVQAANGVIHV
ncbi:MAG: fasciclin, partial [Bacteroidetes bacterium HGW-Bacteroidetes-23]